MRSRGLNRLVVIAAAATVGVLLASLVWDAKHGEEAGAIELPAVAEQMRVFASAPVALEDVPEVVEKAERRLPARAGHGSAMPGQVRRLGRDLGQNGVAAFAFPTTGGAVCILVAEATYAATCVDSFERRSGNVRWMIYSGESSPQTVAGLASNTVANVKVVVDGAIEEARLADNLFFWQSENDAVAREAIEALLVTQSDGAQVRVNLDFRR